MEVRQVERGKKVQTGSWLHGGKAGRDIRRCRQVAGYMKVRQVERGKKV